MDVAVSVVIVITDVRLRFGIKSVERQHLCAYEARTVARRQKVCVFHIGREELPVECFVGYAGAYASLGDEVEERGVCAT